MIQGACIRTPQRHTFGAAFCVVWCHHFRGMPYMSGPCNDQVLWPQSRVTHYTLLPHTLVYWERDPNCWPLTPHCCDRILHMYTYTNTNECYTQSVKESKTLYRKWFTSTQCGIQYKVGWFTSLWTSVVNIYPVFAIYLSGSHQKPWHLSL